MNQTRVQTLLRPTDTFARRHLGSTGKALDAMLATVGVASLEELIDETIPAPIRLKQPLNLPAARTETEALADLRALANRNQVRRSFIGMGYSATITPGVILRNILENPGWYTQYTPYQAEIAQGRLEALLNFQTMVMEMTGMEIANASMLDEATAAAEAMTLCRRAQKSGSKANVFFVSDKVHPQTINVVETRAEALGYQVIVGDAATYSFAEETFGVLIQYPDTDGLVQAHQAGIVARAHEHGALVVVATDLLALALLTPPGEWGADVAVGSSQRFGVPMGYGGPHAAFMATRDTFKRILPGRLVGVSIDAEGNPAMRLTLQTREQHIRREKATSNICTAQVLLAVMASMYAVYHGPDGVREIAERVHLMAAVLAKGLREAGYTLAEGEFFDTIKVLGGPRDQHTLVDEAEDRGINLRVYTDGATGIAFDEATTADELALLLEVFGASTDVERLAGAAALEFSTQFARTSPYLTHPVFHRYHTETEMLRYITRLQSRDLSLANSMIPLGSCTMKLNATAEMLPITWNEFANLHPFAPVEQAQGYAELFQRLGAWLAEITGFAATSFQPNAGSQGEYTGLLTIRAWHRSHGDVQRTVCLIPSSAHGTNPASAAMAGMDVVVVACDERGNIDISDLCAKAEQHAGRLAALMVTYPSTHGVFEEGIREICEITHANGGQVYMDGANMNAQVGICRPGDIGADVCHLNLHKTFAIPHGGGGPGMGPICVASHLAPFLPRHVVVDGEGGQGAVSAAPWGSASILPISYAYIAMMGEEGLRRATQMAILNANYVAARLRDSYPVLYTGANGRVAHECILDMRQLKEWVEVDDIAKRLMDYGFHSPTMSFPVAGTLMVEPTESESKEELDRFCDAMIAIREEIRAIESGACDKQDNALKHAPHTTAVVTRDDWNRCYSREQAAFPLPWVRERKFWPAVSRIDNVYGDRNLVCACPPVEEWAENEGAAPAGAVLEHSR